jgi:hypothetical protein
MRKNIVAAATLFTTKTNRYWAEIEPGLPNWEARKFLRFKIRK